MDPPVFCKLYKHQRPKLPSCQASANFLLVFVAYSMLHTPVGMTPLGLQVYAVQELPRPTDCIE